MRLEDDGVVGYGEASPNAFYGETADDVAERLSSLHGALQDLKIRSVTDIERAWQTLWPNLAPSRAAQCAIDIALWDWFAKREGAAVVGLVRTTAPRAIGTFCTIGLSERSELPNKFKELTGFPLIKIKSDGEARLDALRFVRKRSNAIIVVDANCAWTTSTLDAIADDLVRLNVTFLEQPFPPERDADLHPDAYPLPIIADESCVLEEDVPRLARHFSGFNIKLVKCGGLTPALRMANVGRELGMSVMVGCMLESSALIAAGAIAAQSAIFADLDGAWLLEDDPFTGWRFEHGFLIPPSKPGLGVEPSLELFDESE